MDYNVMISMVPKPHCMDKSIIQEVAGFPACMAIATVCMYMYILYTHNILATIYIRFMSLILSRFSGNPQLL